jgi:hypothetical protein
MKNDVYQWLRLLWSKSLGLAFASGVTVILYTGLLYFMNLFWLLYIETPVGKRFSSLHIIDINAIEGLRTENFFMLSLEVILNVLIVCLVLGAVSQVFLLIRYFHEGRGFSYRLIVWGIPCVALTSVAISRTFEIGPVASFLLGVGPTMALFQVSLRFTSGLLPEISTIIGGIVTLVQKALRRERRGEPRYDIDLPLAYHGPRTSDESRSMASQVSNHGFCVLESKGVAKGDLIRFELRVEDDSVPGEAVIKWREDTANADRKKASSSRSGCRIVSMATQGRNVLRGYLNRHSRKEP